MADDIDALIKVVLRHQRLLDVLLVAISDHACLLEPTLERCCNVDCADAATVRHIDLEVKMCDYHCARTITKAKKNPEGDLIAPIRMRLADENCWLDLEDAPRIRHVKEYVQLIKQGLEADPPEHRDLLH